MRYPAAILVSILCLVQASRALAVGEVVNGFPNWSERVLLEWINRARSDPQADLVGCTAQNCPERQCYTPQPPRMWSAAVAHSARFHSDEMVRNGYFDHSSECTVATGIADTYLATPQQCDGSAACACTEHVITHVLGTGTGAFARMGLFGGGIGSAGEIIAGTGDPDSAFYLWLDEHSSSSTCAYSQLSSSDTNGHRWLILSSQYGSKAAGPGVAGTRSTVDFDDAAPALAKLPSAAHYPQQAASVDVWANWYDAAGPGAHRIDVDGVCSDMSLARGTQANGAWHAAVSGVGSGCHRYVVAFRDAAGKEVLYPTSGSLAIGSGGAQCPEWSSMAPPACAGADRIYRYGFDP
jgi:uncharacterized protein YkwD